MDGAQDGTCGLDEVVFAAGLGFLSELLLQIAVQKFVRIVVGCIGGQEEQLDIVGVALDPGRDLLGVMLSDCRRSGTPSGRLP